MESKTATHISIATGHLDTAQGGVHEIGNLVFACKQLLEICKQQQAQIDRLERRLERKVRRDAHLEFEGI